MDAKPWAVLMFFEELLGEVTGHRPNLHRATEKGRHLAATKKLIAATGGNMKKLEAVMRFWASNEWEVQHHPYPQRIVSQFGVLEQKLAIAKPSQGFLIPGDRHDKYRWSTAKEADRHAMYRRGDGVRL